MSRVSRPGDQHDEHGNPVRCSCCGTSAEEVEIDSGYTDLCLYCQPCGYCGRQGTGCDSTAGSSGCDIVDYPDRPRRDVNEFMEELGAQRREARARERER